MQCGTMHRHLGWGALGLPRQWTGHPRTRCQVFHAPSEEQPHRLNVLHCLNGSRPKFYIVTISWLQLAPLWGEALQSKHSALLFIHMEYRWQKIIRGRGEGDKEALMKERRGEEVRKVTGISPWHQTQGRWPFPRIYKQPTPWILTK